MKRCFYVGALALSLLTMPRASAEYCGPQDCCFGPSSGGCFDFNGFYVGGNVGVVSHTAFRNDLDEFFSSSVVEVGAPAGWSINHTGATAGLQLGYDWQCCNKLVGIVGDWNWTGTERTFRVFPDVAGVDFSIKNRHSWFATIRARAGLVISDALAYVTLGAAAARFNTCWHSADASGSDSFRFQKTHWGWVAGAGTEFLLGCNWSVGLEILYLQFSQQEQSATFAGTTFAFSHGDSTWVGRVLLNYRFGDLFGCCW